MSIDNPLDQVEALIASNERQNSPELADTIVKLIGEYLPGASKIVKLIRHEREKQSVENSALLMKTVVEELKRVGANVDDLHRDAATRDEVRRLVLDAVSKVEDLRDRKRVERIGKILAHAVTLGPMSNFDRAEEMMRVARNLSDQDVLALGQLYDSQFEANVSRGWNLDVDQINVLWRNKRPTISSTVLPAELDGIFLRLQGLGLVTQVERRDIQLGPNERVFALLPNGAAFVRYIQGAVRE